MEILVTGGAGFIGSHVCEALINRGESVICFDNFNDFYDPAAKERNIKEMHGGLFLYRGDICHKEKLEKVFQKHKFSKIVHLAARAGVRPSFSNSRLYHDVNVAGTKNLLELAVKYKVPHFIFGSSSSVYGNSKRIPFSEEDNDLVQISPYAATKREAELLCQQYSEKHGLKATCLRFFTVYGPRGRPDMAIYSFTKKILGGEEIEIYGDGSSKRDYTFVSDITDGILEALSVEFDFEIINLGNSRPVELRYLISLIEKECGKKAKIIHAEKQKGDVEATYADLAKAKRLLGYQPQVPIEGGIKIFVKWFREI
ncbi:GDP-mannose 4,6-dehydratase [Candidatus Woesearchaeota archaeon]|nr:GDP-mannose 4,6-dehydratase [Candidatus Woesearchaeota archaeon]